MNVRTLRVACLVDREVVSSLRKQKASTQYANYDLSVYNTLADICKEVVLVGASANSLAWLDELRALQVDAVFNLTFSASPHEEACAGCLEFLGLPYTGSGPRAIALANDKISSRLLLKCHGIAVPEFVVWNVPGASAPTFPPPNLVKPANLAASLGIYANSFCRSLETAARLAARIGQRFAVPVICDQFIPGREYRIGLVEARTRRFAVAGIVEWKFAKHPHGHGYLTEAIRGNPSVRRAQGVSRAALPPGSPLFSRLGAISAGAAQVLGIRGYASVDLRVGADGRAIILEVNANPGLWGGGLIWTRPTFARTIKAILAAAGQRRHPLVA